MLSETGCSTERLVSEPKPGGLFWNGSGNSRLRRWQEVCGVCTRHVGCAVWYQQLTERTVGDVRVEPAAYDPVRPCRGMGGIHSCLFNLRLLWRARWGPALIWLLLVQLLLLLDPQDQRPDLFPFRLHPLLRKPVRQVHRQMEAGNRTLFEKSSQFSFQMSICFYFLKKKHK